MIEVSQLKKSYGSVEALRGVDFSIAAGEIVGLLGPNGAGKTTIIKILTGYLQADSGTARVDGLDVLAQPEAVQARIGYLPENAPLYPELSVQGYLQMMANLRQIPLAEQRAHIVEAIRAVHLDDYRARPIGTLSKGYRQRVGLAQAILHRPRLLILDEPTVGLDPTQIVEIRNLIKRLAQHSTILFSTHILSEVEALCDRAIILMNGKIRADARLNELAQGTKLLVSFQKPAHSAHETVRALPGVADLQTYTLNGYPALRITPQPQVELSQSLLQLAVQHNWQIRELKYETRTLESVFNELAAGSANNLKGE
ncbi:MAG: ABC transporter ATP-binding protein [Anaerolineales bacterium]